MLRHRGVLTGDTAKMEGWAVLYYARAWYLSRDEAAPA